MRRTEHRGHEGRAGVVDERSPVPGAADLLVQAPVDERPADHEARQPEHEQAQEGERRIDVQHVLAGTVGEPRRQSPRRPPRGGVEEARRPPQAAAALRHDQRRHRVAQHPDDEHDATDGRDDPECLGHASPQLLRSRPTLGRASMPVQPRVADGRSTRADGSAGAIWVHRRSGGPNRRKRRTEPPDRKVG